MNRSKHTFWQSLRNWAREIDQIAGELITEKQSQTLDVRLTKMITVSLFAGTKIAGYLSEDFFQKNLKGFSGSLQLRTVDDRIQIGLKCKQGKICVDTQKKDGWDVVVIFKNMESFQYFMLSNNPDIMAEAIQNNINISGNINQLYKLGFVLNDLRERIGLTQ